MLKLLMKTGYEMLYKTNSLFRNAQYPDVSYLSTKKKENLFEAQKKMLTQNI